ncbi:retrovirus-related pol polyprotein from transposon TNT 1-94 [Tanacetum coccineum]
MCHIIGIEPQFDNIISNGLYIPMAAGQRKPETQWTLEERKSANLDQRLKSLIMSVLPDDQMNFVINCLTAKSTWDNLILYHEGPFDVKESRVMDLKLCYNTFKFKEEDTRSSKEYMNDLEEEYQARALLAKSKRFFKKGTQRFSSAKATDQTKCHKCGKKGHFARDCWSKTSVPSYQSPFQPKLLYLSEHKPESRHTKDFEAKYNKVKAKLALLSSSALAPNLSSSKNKALIAETYDWDEEEVSSDDNEVTEVKALKALADEERVSIGKESARNDEWIKISMEKAFGIKCISEQIPTQKKKILGIDQLTEDTSSSGPKDPVFVKSLADNSEVSITGSNKPKLSEAEDSTLSNHDTSKSVAPPSSTGEADCITKITLPQLLLEATKVLQLLKLTQLLLYHTSQGESSSRSRPSRPVIPFPFCIYCRYNDHQSDDCVYYPICEICGSYDHDTHGHNKIISLRRGIKPRNPQHIIKNCKTCGSNIHTTSDHNDIEWFRKREALQAKKVKSFKASKTKSSSALRSKTPTKRLKQAPRAWYETLSTFLTEHKFVRGKIDNTLFVYKTQTDVILVQIYVDDIIFGSTSTKLCKQFAKLMTQRYEMSMMGVLTYFLGFQIKQSERGISINQEKYVKDLLKKYDINGSSVKTPMVPPNNLGPDLSGKAVNETQYRGMIGSLMYLTASRPDIQFSTCLCARYQANPKESYLIAVKRIFRSPNMYKEYLAEFWHSAKAFENSKVSFSTPTGGIYEEVWVNTFRNTIGTHYLPHSSEYVAPPSIDIVRPWFEKIRYGEVVPAKGTLKKSLLPPRHHHQTKQEHREKVVPYTRFLSLLMMHKMKEGYGDGELTLYPTQVFSVNN